MHKCFRQTALPVTEMTGRAETVFQKHCSGIKLVHTLFKKKNKKTFSGFLDERTGNSNTGIFSSWGWRFSSPETPLARSDGFCGGIYIAI